jgi:uncharacterized membrane protein
MLAPETIMTIAIAFWPVQRHTETMRSAPDPSQPFGQRFGPPAGQRIGDAERDRAVNALSEHLASGRLDQSEFDQRMSAALQARTQSDLEPLFLDLPEPRPVNTPSSPPARSIHPPYSTAAQAPNISPSSPQPSEEKSGCSGPRRHHPIVTGPAIWCVAIALLVLSHGHLWFLMIVAMLVCSGLWGGKGRRRRISHRQDGGRRPIDRNRRW